MFGKMPRWKLFSFAGHPVFLEPVFLLLIAFFVFNGIDSPEQFAQNLMWAPILFISILWHEIGHALAIDKFGYGKSMIILQGLGGVTVNERRAGADANKSIIISLAGPAFSISLVVMFGIAAMVYPNEDPLNFFFTWMAIINAVWAVFNLLPIYPMDGGNVLFGIFQKVYKNDKRKALLHTAYVSLGFLGLVVAASLVFKIISLIWLIIIIFMFGFQNWQIIQQLRR